jgi:hypothetical protein
MFCSFSGTVRKVTRRNTCARSCEPVSAAEPLDATKLLRQIPSSNMAIASLSVLARRHRLQDGGGAHRRYDGHQHEHREQRGREHAEVEPDVEHDQFHQASRIH